MWRWNDLSVSISIPFILMFLSYDYCAKWPLRTVRTVQNLCQKTCAKWPVTICYQILMRPPKPFVAWPSQILLFFIRTSLFDLLCKAMIFVNRFSFCLQLETNFSVSCLKRQSALSCNCKLLSEIKRYAAVNSASFIHWKNPRIILVCRSIDTLSCEYLHKIIELNQLANKF